MRARTPPLCDRNKPASHRRDRGAAARPSHCSSPATAKLSWVGARLVSIARLARSPLVLALSSQGLVTSLQGLFGPLFLGIVGIVAIFFLFTREITRFVQFIVLAVAIAVVFYTPSIVQTLADGIANALGVH